MSDDQTYPDAVRQLSRAEIAAGLASLPPIRTCLGPEQVLGRVQQLSRRGKLPGLVAGPGRDAQGLFSVAAFGAPFDYRLVAVHAQDHVRFTARRLGRLPAIYAAVLALTVWPGVIFTDSLLNTWFNWYPNDWWVTWAWYIPLTAGPIPWIWRSVADKSRASALGHAHEQIAAIAQAIEGEPVTETGA
jgi:hypothetical protein